MKVLCVHHKGGVGKTTTAIHVTGVLLENASRVLLIDGDSQADSFRFFSEGSVVSERDNRNPSRLAGTLGKLANDKLFEHTVIDIATDLPNISTILFEIQPDLVLVGVKRDDIGSFVHLNDMLLAVEQARPIVNSSLRLKVVPIGVKESDFKEYINSRFLDYEVLEPVDWLPVQAGKAIFINYEYLWSEPGYEHLWQYYKQVLI
ncbi:hypothetical protein RIVM261_030520 [Rivularia sp. IAM M-261]|nr:hypothetical protein RIVM261_030520 [Rivularia sp. IAM M-261]